jgi:sulfotransferase
MHSIELVIRRNPFDVSRLFNNPAERATVYSRTETLSQGSRLVAYAYNALKEAFYSEQSGSILRADYELLTIMPSKTMSLIYQFIGEEPFNHNFDNVQYNKTPKFDKKQKTQGLHQVRDLVNFNKLRKTILLPDLFELFDGLYFLV